MTRESSNLYRRKTFATGTTAAGKRSPTATRGLAGKKPMLAFAANFRRLILAFHKKLIKSRPA
jgi:hypothetical protein